MKHRSAQVRGRHASRRRAIWRYLSFQGLKAALMVRSPALTARILASACRPLEGSWDKSKPRLWMLGKEGLTEDLIDSIRNGNWAYPFDFSRGIPKVIARKYLPAGVDDNSYANTSREIDGLKIKYRDMWREIFEHLASEDRPDAITTGNFGYYAERELAHAAEDEGIPFIALHKECLKSEGRLEFFREIYKRRGRFMGRRILVYNERERELQIRAGVAEPEQVTICGMPRLDRLHRWRVAPGPEMDRPKTLLALGFTPKTGLPRVPRKGKHGPATYEYLEEAHEKMGWDKLFRRYHETLVRLASDNPEWRVVLKLKSRPRDAEPSVTLIRQLDAPENFQIIVGGDPLELFKVTDVVAGFNTTAALEGMAAGLPVVTPDFDEVQDPGMRDFAAMFEAAHKPRSPAEMYEVVTELMKTGSGPQKHLTVETTRTLETWVGNADGRAGERVRAAFENEMGI